MNLRGQFWEIKKDLAGFEGRIGSYDHLPRLKTDCRCVSGVCGLTCGLSSRGEREREREGVVDWVGLKRKKRMGFQPKTKNEFLLTFSIMIIQRF